MSSHSRSSSDSDKISVKDILPIFLQDFLKDFSFLDISNHVRHAGIFNDEDYGKIMAQTDDKQIILMFFKLTDRPELIENFLKILNIDYDWLSSKVLNYHNTVANKELTQYIHALQDLRCNFPKHSDFNVHRLNYYCTIREHLLKLRPHNYLIISGDLGFGKKWLTVDACCDFSVMKRLRFKLFWIDVHNCDSQERDLEKLQRLKILLSDSTTCKKAGDYEGISNKILELQQDIRSILKEDEYKNCLLVLSNVRNYKTIQTFKLGCKTLVITRIKDFTRHIESSLIKTVHIDEGFTQSEFVNLFEKILKVPKEKFPENSNDLFDQSKGHAFMLNMIAQNLKGQKNSEWNRWIKNLDDFHIDDDKISNIIQLSLNVLRPDELELFKTLAIFYHSIKIPIKVLAGLWNKSEYETKIIVQKFDKFSLVNIDFLSDNESMACCIHFLYYSYLKKCDDIDKQAINRDLIKSYKIEKALNNRNEFDLIELPNDEYFHYFIGFHLREAGMIEFFSKLYLDFGFLGQKLRATGLPNTIGDLKYYRKEITSGDCYKEKLVNSLLDFLPNIEEMIFRSNDTYLLQYALMGDGLLHEEALKQAKQFPDKIWFFDGGHFHRRRQMISLPGKPKSLKLIEPDTCLIALEDHVMLLADLSLGYNIEPTKFVGHDSDIIAIDLFDQNYLISLDRNGEIRIWSIADERRRSITRKQSSRLILNHINFANAKMRKKDSIQLIKLNGERQSIKHFQIDNHTEYPNIGLHLVLANGDICNYKWNDNIKKFEAEIVPPLNTRVLNIQFILKIFNFYVVIDNMGNLKPFHICDSSSRALSFVWPDNTNAPIRVHYFHKGRDIIVIFVFGMKIIQVNFPKQTFQFLKGELDTIYKCPDRRSAITCSCLSDDNRYLIIGTKQGIIVFDTIEKSEVLRNSISESIVCVDIYSLDDDIYKYTIVSGSEGRKALNIFGLKLNSNQSITWANSIGTLGKETNLNPQFEPNAWLVGKKLFDVNFYENSSSLVALDSKNRIHQMTIENKNWSLIVPTDINCKITAITASTNDDYYYGCENGKIFKAFEEELVTNIFTKSITFLKLIDDLLIASSTFKNECMVYRNDKEIFRYDFDVINVDKLFDKYLVMWDKKCNIMILDIDKSLEIWGTRYDDIKEKPNSEQRLLGGSDFKSNLLIMGTIYSQIYVYKFVNNEDLQITPLLMHDRNENEEITCLSISPDLNYCAVGLKSGLIEIYKIDVKLELMRKLISHKSQIYEMKFSPWSNSNDPLILASSSEQLCFWDINYVINNPIWDISSNSNKDRRRHSSRFNSSSSNNNLNDSDCQIITTTTTSSTTTPQQRRKRYYSDSTSPTRINKFNLNYNPWEYKKGPSNNPELLSCIKYAGTKAEKFYANDNFTKFITIDDEGEYYLLNVQNIDNEISNHQNGNLLKMNGNKENHNFLINGGDNCNSAIVNVEKNLNNHIKNLKINNNLMDMVDDQVII